MKGSLRVLLAGASLMLWGCGQGGGSTGLDGCTTAVPHADATLVNGIFGPTYTGDLNNYWGLDTTRLDSKHVFENGQLVKSYTYYHNQNVEEERTFKCGALHGEQKWYREDGSLKRVEKYRYGRKESGWADGDS